MCRHQIAMHASSRVWPAILLLLAFVTAPFAPAAGLSLSGQNGAVVTFTQDELGWKWTGLTVPGRSDVQALDELGYQIVTDAGSVISPTPADWQLIENTANRVVFERTFETVGVALRRIYSFGPADNVVRLETWVRAVANANRLVRLSLLNAHFHGRTFKETGGASQSFPLLSDNLFVGIEHVSGECHTWDEVAYAGQTPNLALGADWKFVTAVVVGWPAPGTDVAPGQSPIRAAFLRYLDTVRVKPSGIELHTNTWWTLPLPFTEEDVMRDLDALEKGFYQRTGMFFDSYALDLGWSDRHSVWRVDAQRFPHGLRAINDRLGKLGAKLGLWISPGSAYPDGLDNAWLAQQGYGMTPSKFGSAGEIPCFAFGGAYENALKDSITGYARDLGLGHVKLDFMARTCSVAEHGHATDPCGSTYVIDAGLADVLDTLRTINPRMALEPLVCGTPPSPWWTMHTPFMLGPDGDDVPYGRVPCPEWIESLITARDTAYRAHQQEWLMPTQALETFDIVVQCPGDFENMAAMAIGRGRWFISTYIKPDYMKPADWDFLAAMVRWTKANKQYLVDAQPFGGKPELKQAYGYLFHNAGRDIYCIRNPWMEWRSITLPLPDGLTAARDLRTIYPRRSTLRRVNVGAAAPSVTLAPYETMIIELVPAGATTKVTTQPARPRATFSTPVTQWSTSADGISHYSWDATVTVPDVNDASVAFLVQGAREVKDAVCRISIAGNPASVEKTGSAGQFAAASGDPVENWTWFTASIAGGEYPVHIEVDVPSRSATCGVYLRGTTAAVSDPMPATGTEFPVFRPQQRAWSETLSANKTYTTKAVTVKSK